MSKKLINEQVQNYLDTLYTKNKLQDERYSVMNKEIVSEGLLSVVLGYLLGSASSDIELAKKHEAGYQMGKEHGYETGVQAGKEVGHAAGYKAGQEVGYGAGMEDTIYGAAAIALAGAISVAAYKVYKAKFSKAARACVQYKGIEKEECMLKFKKDALKYKITILQKGASKLCAKNKNPGECRARIQAKIAEANSKMQSKK